MQDNHLVVYEDLDTFRNFSKPELQKVVLMNVGFPEEPINSSSLLDANNIQ